MQPAKLKTIYACQSCGAQQSRWLGKCPECGTWNSLVEEKISLAPTKRGRGEKVASEKPVALSTIEPLERERYLSGLDEFDRILGGGAVDGSTILVGGDPGIGKSTLLLQVGAAVAKRYGGVLYISGEESHRQIKMRAERLGLEGLGALAILTETDAQQISATVVDQKPVMVVIDSIQTTFSPYLESPPGTVGQIRECAAILISQIKKQGGMLFLVGHVTKDGAIAGPKVLEHMVDTVLYFEGEKHHLFRILRAVKNRFGSTNEIGIFQMQEQGLVEVANPSGLFLAERDARTSGSAVVASIEGTRPLLVEIQALVTPASYGTPQRVASGIDQRRLSLLIAILEKRVRLPLGTRDVFVNVAGGLRLDEPAVDLGLVAAIASSFEDKPVDPQAVLIGEVGLGGEVRGVGQIDRRLKEAEKLGFRRAILPGSNLTGEAARQVIALEPVRRVEEALRRVLQK